MISAVLHASLMPFFFFSTLPRVTDCNFTVARWKYLMIMALQMMREDAQWLSLVCLSAHCSLPEKLCLRHPCMHLFSKKSDYFRKTPACKIFPPAQIRLDYHIHLVIEGIVSFTQGYEWKNARKSTQKLVKLDKLYRLSRLWRLWRL